MVPPCLDGIVELERDGLDSDRARSTEMVVIIESNTCTFFPREGGTLLSDRSACWRYVGPFFVYILLD